MFNQLIFIYYILNIYYLKLHGKEIPSDTGEFIISHGYKNETHIVKTDDGYHLTLHRITGKQNDTQQNSTKPVVLLGHGLVSSSASFVLAGPKNGLGYILSDEGYDVWLANFRGNKYSQIHDDYTVKSKAFWDFSWHEMGKFDLPAMIEYIMYKTNVEKIFYVGYSQGTTAYFVFSSLYPEFADKHLHAAIALAPVVHMNHIELDPIVKSFSKISNNLIGFVKTFISDDLDASLYYNVGKNRETLERTLKYFNSSDNLKSTGKIFRAMVYGFNELRTDNALLPLIYRHIPDGTSLKQLLHYVQIINSGVFQTYEPDIFNLRYWWKNSPEKYNVSQCKVNTALFYSNKDWVSTPKDVIQLANELFSVKSYLVDSTDFGHLDFIFATDVKELVYDRVLEFMQNILILQ